MTQALKLNFLWKKNSAVVPIEVKSHKGETSSLDTLLKKDEIEKGYKIMNGNVGKVGKKITIPHYMALFL